MTSQSIVQSNLIATLDKREVLETLKQWRYESKEKLEADLLNDLIREILSGELDG